MWLQQEKLLKIASFEMPPEPLLLTWIINCMYHKVWDDITYPFLNFNRATIEDWEWLSNFIPHLIMDVITPDMLISTRHITPICHRIICFISYTNIFVKKANIWYTQNDAVYLCSLNIPHAYHWYYFGCIVYLLFLLIWPHILFIIHISFDGSIAYH